MRLVEMLVLEALGRLPLGSPRRSPTGARVVCDFLPGASGALLPGRPGRTQRTPELPESYAF